MEFLIILLVVIGIVLFLVPQTAKAKLAFREGLDGKRSSVKTRQNGKGYSNSSHLPQENAQFKATGDEFEKYIAQRFGKYPFTLRDWRSDKFANGVYAKSNMNPDLEIEFRSGSTAVEFAVECKYRSRIFNDIMIAEQRKIDNYRRFSKEKQMPVFIIIGISGQPSSPKECYVVPLGDVTGETMKYTDLQRFRKFNIDNGFYFDLNTALLR